MNTNHGQDPTSKKATSIEACCLYVAQKLNGRDYSTWKNADYINLSAQIRRNTKVHISENTLKRFFGKLKTPADYQPQKATRDALAVFIGYTDWDDFESKENTKQQIDVKEEPYIGVSPEQTSPPTDNTSRTTKKSLFVAVCLIFFLAAGIFFYRSNSSYSSPPNVNLFCTNPTGHSPHSAIFKLRSKDGTPIKLNEYQIDFKNWRGGKDHWKDSTISCYYEKAGVYYPKLYHNGTAIDSTQVVLLSKGWEVSVQAQQDTLRLYPILQSDQHLAQPPTISMQNVYSAGVDTMKTFFTNFSYIKPENISADNIRIEADIQASQSRPGVRCSQADIIIYGKQNAHYFSLMKPECISWSYYKFGEILKLGKNEDLSKFGHDMVQKRRLRVDIIEQHVHIYLDNNLIFNTKYTKAIGQFMGLNFMFGGIGRIENVVVKGC